MAIRRRGRGRWQVRVKPFPEITVPTKEAAETVELDLKLRKKLGHLFEEKAISLGEELDGFVARKNISPAGAPPLVAMWRPARTV